jgi:hypothetical protein
MLPDFWPVVSTYLPGAEITSPEGSIFRPFSYTDNLKTRKPGRWVTPVVCRYLGTYYILMAWINQIHGWVCKISIWMDRVGVNWLVLYWSNANLAIFLKEFSNKTSKVPSNGTLNTVVHTMTASINTCLLNNYLNLKFSCWKWKYSCIFVLSPYFPSQ